MFKNGIDCSINHKIVDPEGRYIILKACIQDEDYVLINVYAPNKYKDQAYFQFTTYFQFCKMKIWIRWITSYYEEI